MDFLTARIQQVLTETLSRYELVLPCFPALLGDGRGNVQVGSQPGFVWVRLGAEGEDGITMAWNQTVQERDGLAIKVGYKSEQPTLFQVICQREVYAGTGEGRIAQIGPHGETHIWGHPAGGNDIVYVWLRQWMPFRVGTKSGFVIEIAPGIWRGWEYKSAQEVDLVGYHPSGFAARYVLVALDFEGDPVVQAGPLVSPPHDLTLATCPVTELTEKPLAAVALYGPQSKIRDSDDQYDIVDLRWPDFGSLDAIAYLREMIAHLEADLDFELTQLVLRVAALRQDAIHRELDLDFTMSMHLVHGN